MTDEQQAVAEHEFVAMAIEIATAACVEREREGAARIRTQEILDAEQDRFSKAVLWEFQKRWPGSVDDLTIDVHIVEQTGQPGDEYRVMRARLVDVNKEQTLYQTPPDAATFDEMVTRLGAEVAKWVAERLQPADYDPTAKPARVKGAGKRPPRKVAKK